MELPLHYIVIHNEYKTPCSLGDALLTSLDEVVEACDDLRSCKVVVLEIEPDGKGGFTTTDATYQAAERFWELNPEANWAEGPVPPVWAECAYEEPEDGQSESMSLDQMGLRGHGSCFAAKAVR